MPEQHHNLDEYDERTLEVAFGRGPRGSEPEPEPRAQQHEGVQRPTRPELDATRRVAQAAASAPSAQERPGQQVHETPAQELSVDGVEIATMVTSAVLGGAITDERRPGEFSGAFDLWTCPPDAVDVVRGAIATLGLPVDRRPVPAGTQGYLRGVPREALEVSGEPAPLVAAVAEGLRDRELLGMIGAAMARVRFGGESTVGRRGAVLHAVRVEPNGDAPLQLGHDAEPPDARATCPCGADTGLLPGREALIFASVHMRLEIEAELDLLGRGLPEHDEAPV